MHRFKFENQGAISYLVYEVQAEDKIDTISLNMLSGNQIKGLADTTFLQMDDKRFISLGDSPAGAFGKITAKMMLPGVASGAILSWITLINELSSSVMLYTARTRTMSVAIYNEVIRASYGTAAALATILTITTVLSLLIFFRISGGKNVTM